MRSHDTVSPQTRAPSKTLRLAFISPGRNLGQQRRAITNAGGHSRIERCSMTVLQGRMRSKHVRIDRSSVEPIKVNTHPVACTLPKKGLATERRPICKVLCTSIFIGTFPSLPLPGLVPLPPWPIELPQAHLSPF